MSLPSASLRTGVLQALGAYTLWGLFPLYVYLIRGVPPLEILGHRVVWCLLFLVVVLMQRRQWAWLRTALTDARVLATFAATALLIAGNWFAYLWSVAAGHVIEAALGYFINPLVSVLFGALFLRERLNRVQWLSMALAGAGVVWMGAGIGHVPWVALFIAVTFSAYGLLRKVAPLGPLEGLTLESLVLTPIALWLLVHLHGQGSDHFSQASLSLQVLVALSGIVTALPLLLFAASTRRIPMTWVGMLQYYSPTLQTLIGVLVFGDAIGARLPGFLLIWAACVVFVWDLLRRSR